MKHIFTFLCLLSAFLASAQTPLISHKSHAGTSLSFFIDPSSNFGRIEIPENFQPQIPSTTENFKPLNDSVMIIETMDLNQKIIKIDTLPNRQRYSQVLFQYKYKDSIQRIVQEELYKREMEQEQQLQKQQMDSQKQLNEPAPAKKKKKSYLLFLFGITGGGMLLTKLFRKSKITQQSIA